MYFELTEMPGLQDYKFKNYDQHVCGKCKKDIAREKKTWGPGNVPWHKHCLACASCGRRLESETMEEFRNKPYCSTCYENLLLM